jgi:PilZ domain
MAAPKCPICSREFVKRASRRGVFEKFLSYFYIFPFRCQLCHYRFRRIQWGTVYRKIVYDRREFERVPVYLNVSISAESGENCNGALQDLSLGGCRLTTAAEFGEGAILRLGLCIPSQDHPIVIDAAAVRNIGIEHTHVEFLQLEHNERQRLRLLLKELQEARNAVVDDKTVAA